MKVVADLDPVMLERELLARIDEVHPTNEPGSTLILVPTARLASHLQRRLADRRPAWLGLHVSDFSRLAREILRQGGGAAPRVASSVLLDALVGRVVRAQPRNTWATFARRRPGVLGRLRETMQDLREAGVDPAAVAECVSDGERDRGLAELYAAYDGALERWPASGWTDRAGLVRAAIPRAAARLGRTKSAFVYGAYEWIGVNLDLLREIDRSTDLTVLIPAHFGSPVSGFAERYARRYLLNANDEPASSPERREPALDALYDEQSRPTPAPPGRLAFAHAQGAAAEVKLAVRRALDAVASGCPPAEIAIVARSLAPYAVACEEVLDEEGLDWTSSLAVPLRRHPLVRDFLALLQVIAEDLPRRGIVRLLRSPCLRWPALLPEGSRLPDADTTDLWSREAKILGGLEDWTLELPRWAEEHEADAAPIAAFVSALRTAVGTEARGWRAYAEMLHGLLDLLAADTRAIEALRETLDDMVRLETLAGETGTVEFAEMRAWIERAVDGSELKLHPDDGGGIRVLDAMQLRGMTFRNVFLLGMNSGLFPRAPREDPILDDRTRRVIAERTGRPLVLKLEAADEERLLLALVVGSASETVGVSWQRADESGKARTPSLALRELARLRYGSPELQRARDDALHLPSHPTQLLEALLEDPGLLSPSDEILLSVLRGHDVDSSDEIRERYPNLEPGMALLRATQSFGGDCAEFDARVGDLPAETELSVSAIETLGGCPLRFFFRSVLRVRELDEEATAVEIAANEMGTVIHDLLERIYRTLAEEGLFEPERSVDLVSRGLELLAGERDRVFGRLGERLTRRMPLLWHAETTKWFDKLRAAIHRDLRAIEARSLVPRGFEERCRRRLELGEGVVAPLTARFDRRLEGPDGVVVGDYKASRNLDDRVNPTLMLKGRSLQVPLYEMLAEADIVELIGIDPRLGEEESHRSFRGFDNEEQSASFRDTLRVLLRLRSGGIFPFNEDRHCRWCSYTAACRRNHPPTIAREERSADAAGYRGLSRKAKTKPYG